MSLLLKWLVITLCVVSAYSSPDDPGPQHFGSTPAPAVSTQSPRYVMKDAILYLTPTQIKALEATQGLNKVVPVGNMNDNEQLQKAQYSDEELEELGEVIKHQLQQLNMYENEKKIESSSMTPIVVLDKQQELQETYVPRNPQIPIALTPSNYFLPSEQQTSIVPISHSFLRLYTNNEINGTPNLHFFHPVPHDGPNDHPNVEVQEDPLHHKRYKLVPYQWTDAKSETNPNTVDHSPRITVKVEEAKTAPAINLQLNKLDENNLPKYLSALKYAPQYVVHKNAAGYQKMLNKIENDNAIAKANAVRNSLSQAQKEQTNNEPLQIIKHVNLPVPTPIYFPVSPLQIKQPHSVPLDIFNPLSLTPIPFMNVERPYIIENIVPVPMTMPEKLTIIRHVWND
ncbi:hypothetical protein ACJJTC_009451 [Scirpophaga incertulas]